MIYILEGTSSYKIKKYYVCPQNTNIELRISNNVHISYLDLLLQDYYYLQ